MLALNKVLYITGALMLSVLISFSQNNNTTSPFSRYGLGEIQPYSFGRTAAMGGATIGSRHTVQINSANPASYNSLDSLSFNFEFGLDGKFSNYKSSLESLKTDDINFRYFAMNWPVTRALGIGMGIQPYSDMGYEIAFLDSVDGAGNFTHNYLGEGSLSKAFIGASLRLFKGLSVGANLQYTFGQLSKKTYLLPSDGDIFYIQKSENIRLRDFRLNYGLQYDIKLKEANYLTLGITFENKSDQTAKHQVAAFKKISVGTVLTDTIEYTDEENGIIRMPSTIGFGLSYNKLDKFEINADYVHTAWSKATFFGATDEVLTDQNRFSIGMEYIPDARSIRSYYSKVKYRAGFHYENSYLKLNNHQIKEIGISFGVGLPVSRSKSTVNFAAELGKRGTTKYGLVKDEYLKLSLYLNLHDYWFVKRKYD